MITRLLGGFQTSIAAQHFSQHAVPVFTITYVPYGFSIPAPVQKCFVIVFGGAVFSWALEAIVPDASRPPEKHSAPEESIDVWYPASDVGLWLWWVEPHPVILQHMPWKDVTVCFPLSKVFEREG